MSNKNRWKKLEKSLDTFCLRPGAFLGLESLEWLKMNGNSLTELNTQDLFPLSLKVPHMPCAQSYVNVNSAAT